MTQTSAPVMKPRSTAADKNAASRSATPNGATSRSTIVPCSLAMNIDDDVLRNAFWVTVSSTRPGMMKRMYDTPSTSRTRPPSA